MLKDELLEKIKSAEESSKSSPKSWLAGGLMIIGIAVLMYIIGALGWLDIERMWYIPLGIGIFFIVVMAPLKKLTSNQAAPIYGKMYELVKTQPQSIFWAYKHNTYRRSVVVSSSLVLRSRSGLLLHLKYFTQNEVDKILDRLPVEYNQHIAIGFTVENRKRFLKNG